MTLLTRLGRDIRRAAARLLLAADGDALLPDADADDDSVLPDADADDDALPDADDDDDALPDADAGEPSGPFDAYIAGGDEDVGKSCEHCLQEWKLAEAIPLTSLCVHGVGKSVRVFAEAVRVHTLPDGRVTIILDFAETVNSPASQGVVLISNADGELFRVKLAHRGASVLADRWRP